MRYASTLIFLLLLLPQIPQAQKQQDSFTAMWWNIENFFDTRDDTLTADEEFTPDGDRHWTRRRFNNKRNGIYKTILMAGLPDVVGLTEVENAYVLRELCNGTPLRQSHYQFIHYDSPDHRGIDCALLYRTDRFHLFGSRLISMSDTANGFHTRDILLVEGSTASNDTVILLINHWPSKRGGNEAERRRMHIAETLRSLMDSIYNIHPTAAVLAMGDLNATPDEAPVSQGMGFKDECANPEGIQNLACLLPDGWGSYRYQGLWGYIDAMFLLADNRWQVKEMELLRFDHLLTPEKRNTGHRPRRTYRGPMYEGGLSDHLPLKLTLAL